MVVVFLGTLLSSSVALDALLVTITDGLARNLPQIAGLQPHVNRFLIPLLSLYRSQ